MMMVDGADAEYTRVAQLPSTAKVYYKFEEERLIEVKIEYNDDQPTNMHCNPNSVFGNSFQVEKDDMDKEEYILDSDFDVFNNPTLLYNVDDISSNSDFTEDDSSENSFTGELNPTLILSRYYLDKNLDERITLHMNQNDKDTSFKAISSEETDFVNRDLDIETLDVDSDLHRTPSSGLHISTSIDNDFEVPLPILRSKSTSSRNIFLKDIDSDNTPEPYFKITKSVDDEFDFPLDNESSTPLVQSSRTFASSEEIFIKDVDSSFGSESFVEVAAAVQDDLNYPIDNEPSTTYTRNSFMKDIDSSDDLESYIKMTTLTGKDDKYALDNESNNAALKSSNLFTMEIENLEKLENHDDDISDDPHQYFKITTSIDDDFDPSVDNEYSTAEIQSSDILKMERELDEKSEEDANTFRYPETNIRMTTPIGKASTVIVQSSSLLSMEGEKGEISKDNDDGNNNFTLDEGKYYNNEDIKYRDNKSKESSLEEDK